jgi:uncharacterized protein
MFGFRAMFAAPARPDDALPPVKVTLPDGSAILSDDSRFAEVISSGLGKPVTLAAAGQPRPTLEEYWPDLVELAFQETVTDEVMPAGTFFDLATVHVLTTATIDRLRRLHPEGRFEVRRFRPNIVVHTTGDVPGFAESTWIGRELRLGDEVVIEITDPCPRCVMTTLPQGDLPQDNEILRTVARHNGGHVGVYAQVHRTGTIRRGDPVTLL